MTIQQYVIDYFLGKDLEKTLNRNNILSFNYMENAFFSSVEFIEMIANFEDHFSIQFSEECLRDERFFTISSLITMLEELTQEVSEC